MSYDRYCAEIITQTALTTAAIEGADLAIRVPTCPEWNLGQLLGHLGSGHRWAEEIVRTRASQPPPDDALRAPSAVDGAVDGWLGEGAAALAATLLAAGPGAQVWAPLPGEGTPFLARRFAHETLIHRADATLAVGGEFDADEDLALDALDEWMMLGSLPQIFDFQPHQRELLGPGRTLAFHATDARADWLVDLTGDLIACRPTREPAAVSVHAPLVELLLVLYGRLPARGESVHVEGDEQLLDFWLERVAFG
jgi:uncharacterized protein (TIGR03083 family)